MNPFFVASLLENPLVLAAILLLGVLSNWLMQRRRQDEEQASLDESDLPPSQAEQKQPDSPPTLQDVLRQLLGGEPPVIVPPPPPISASREHHSLPDQHEAEQHHSTQRWQDDSDEVFDRLQQRAGRAAELLSDTAARVKANDDHQHVLRLIAPLSKPAEYPLRGVPAARRRRRSVAMPPMRGPDAVRRAYVASLIFSPPKGLEP